MSRNLLRSGVGLALALLVPACTKTIDCANAKLELDFDEKKTERGIYRVVDITGTTKDGACPCKQLGFIQVARLAHLPGNTPFHPNPEQADRMTKDGANPSSENAGWAVERRGGGTALTPWYPHPDVTGDDPGSIKIHLHDEPGADRNVKFELITCLCCRDPLNERCKNLIYCCVYWTFEIDEKGEIVKADTRDCTPEDERHFKAALEAWNDQAHNHPVTTGQNEIDPLPHK